MAEAQANNPLYETIRVERNLGRYLINRITGERPCVIILTGHAGDGKTSLIIQVLRSLNLLPLAEQLKETDQVNLPDLDGKLLYVKDMSELTENSQEELLLRAFESPRQGNSAILVSNTGPLIKTITRHFKHKGLSKEEILSMENKVLDRMDNNDIGEILLGEYPTEIINIARVDNTLFMSKILENILKPELWKPCLECYCTQKCSIYNNYTILSKSYERISRFIQDLYRWLYENDNRITIRQMIAQLSYAITGGLDCNRIKEIGNSKNLFNYHFANLFFGFHGTEQDNAALQIKAVRVLQKLSLDQKSFSVDYQLFVNQDFSCFPLIEKDLLLREWSGLYQVRKLAEQEDEINEDIYQEDLWLRQAIRRFYLLFSLLTDEEYSQLLNDTFSPVYSDYLEARKAPLTQSLNHRIHTTVTRALYYIFVGFPPSHQTKTLYLTLRSEGQSTPAVQLLQGEINFKQIRVDQKKVTSNFDSDDVRYDLLLTTKQLKKPFVISLPTLDYFKRICDGGIATKLNPSLTHNIDKLKSNLVLAHRDDSRDLRVLINTTKGEKVLNMYFEDNELRVED